MPAIQDFGIEKQTAPPVPVFSATGGGLGLGNSDLQFNTGSILQRRIESRQPTKLEVLKRMHFSQTGRAERIAKSLAALNQPESLKLTSEEWHFFAEDEDLEDQD